MGGGGVRNLCLLVGIYAPWAPQNGDHPLDDLVGLLGFRV